MRFIYTLSLLFICLHIGHSQNLAPKEIEKALATYRQVFQPEKVYLHTDKDVYAAGETIWYAAYLVDGQNHVPIVSNRALRVELINAAGKIVQEQKLLLPIGQAAGDFSLAGKLPAGDYLLRAYTNHQRNFLSDFFFTKKLRILPGILAEEPPALATAQTSSGIASASPPNIQVRFFPEGGDCINDLTCRLAFLAEMEGGGSVEVSGRIEDETGRILTFFESVGRGMGSFLFTPQAGHRYEAIIEDRGRVQRYPIPDFLDRGYNLQLSQRNDTLQIKVLSNLDSGLKDTRLVLHVRGILLANLLLQADANAVIKVPTSGLPNGILTTTLFNPIGDPVAERLSFINTRQTEPSFTMQARKNNYRPNQSGKIDIRMASTLDTVPPALLSMSIIENDFYTAGGENIRSYLLLNADLNIPIEEAGLIVGESQATPEQQRLLDHLLMTKGWRRFRWRPLLTDQLPAITYATEEGIYLEGNLHKYENRKKPEQGKVFMSILDEQFYSEEMPAAEDGSFRFGPFVYYDTAQIVLQARMPRNKKKKLADLTLDDNPYVGIQLRDDATAPVSPLDTPWVWDTDRLDNYRTQSEQSLTIARNFDSLIIDLDVVELRASRIKKKDIYEERVGFYSNPDNRMIIDSLPGYTGFQSIFDVLRRVAGVRVSGPRNQETVEIRGITSIQLSSEPIYVLDGIQVDIQTLRTYPIVNVEFIDVIKGARAAIYGSRGANGAILVYSRRGPSLANQATPGVKNLEVPGFYKAREFFVANSKKDTNRPDVRTTLHWQPDIITDDIGKATVEFLSSTDKGTYRVILEGIDANGQAIFGTTTFQVE